MTLIGFKMRVQSGDSSWFTLFLNFNWHPAGNMLSLSISERHHKKETKAENIVENTE